MTAGPSSPPPGRGISAFPNLPSIARTVAPWLGVALVALAARWAYLIQIADSPLAGAMLGDAQGYHDWANDILRDGAQRRGVFYQAPLYPYFLACIYTLGGDGWWWRNAAQSLLGVGTCLLVGWSARRMFGPVTGWTACLMVSLNPTLIFFDGQLQKTVLDVFLAAVLMALVAWTSARRSSAWSCCLLGAGIALWGLSRENAVLVTVPIAIWLAVGAESWTARLRSLAWLAVGLALLLGPVAARNRLVGGQWALTTSQWGPNLYIGNHRGASGTYQALLPGRGNVAVEQLDAARLAQRALGRPLSSQEVSRYWLAQVWQFARSAPSEFFRLQAFKALLLINTAELADTEDQYTHTEFSSWLALLTAASPFGAWLALAAVGGWASWPDRRQVWIWYAIPLTYAISVLAFYVVARYRAPLVVWMAPLAAYGLVEIVAWCRQRRWKMLFGGLAIAAAAGVVALLPLTPTPRQIGAITWLNLGVERQRHGHDEEALAYFQAALERSPSDAWVHWHLGYARHRLNDLPRALASFDAALAQQPGHVPAMVGKGLVLAQMGQPDQGLDWLQRAVQADPTSAPAHYHLGNLLRAAAPDDPAAADQALRHHQQAVDSDPEDPLAWLYLGAACQQQGDYERAHDAFQRSVELDPLRSEAYLYRANLRMAFGRYDEAEADFRQAAQCQDSDVRPYLGLGWAAYRRQQYAAAIEFLQQALVRSDTRDAALRRQIEDLIELCRHSSAAP